MAGGGPIDSGSQINSDANANKSYLVPIVFMVTLFFFIGFITVLNDVLIPALRDIFNFKEEKWKAMLIQFCFFTGYFVMSVPAGILVSKVGYKKSLLISLGLTALGLFMFWPAAYIMSYGFYLLALFIVACGLAILQVVINPYLTALGSPETGASRLNFGGALNSTATTIGPVIGASLFLKSGVTDPAAKAASMSGPYAILAAIIVFIAVMFAMTKLPKLRIDSDPNENPWDFSKALKFRHLKLGAGAIFFYVGAEVAIGSLLVIYIIDANMIKLPAEYVKGLDAEGVEKMKELFTTSLLTYYWGGAMIGRFAGSAITRAFKPEKVLAFVAIVAVVLINLSFITPLLSSWMNIPVFVLSKMSFITVSIPIGIFCLVLVGLFNSIMWPTIFPLGIKGLGKHTGKGSGVMVTMVFGGAVIPFITGLLADKIGYKMSFALVLFCYAYIFYFATKGHKNVNPDLTEEAMSESAPASDDTV